MVAGVLLFWVGYLFYAAPSYYTVFVARQFGPAKIFNNAFLAGSTGGLTALILKPVFIRSHKHRSFYDCLSICNGILVGLVSVTAGIDRFEAWAAIVVALCGAIFYCIFCQYLSFLWIDDPLEGSAVHFIGGAWALIADGFLDTAQGAFYDDPDKAHFFAFQVAGVFVVFLWVFLISMTYFWAMYEMELLRINQQMEIVGFDLVELDGLSLRDYQHICYYLKNRAQESNKMLKKKTTAILLEEVAQRKRGVNTAFDYYSCFRWNK
mmetsp:Transcript_28435/g.21243  ORF Transcript_28435/g.21243 Transcript_28435/m.21243 type:complete len:265 (+) Transcript_28435:756-1550(+)